MIKLEERLNEIIEEKEEVIEELKEKIETFERNSDLKYLKYQLHEYFKESELQKKLPVPRLEMRFKRLKTNINNDNWYNVIWHYGIVYKHYADTDNDTMLFIPISHSSANGGDGTFESHLINGKIDTPLRGGVHIFAESKLFNLPAYIICEEMNIYQEINLEMDIKEQLSKMIRSEKDIISTENYEYDEEYDEESYIIIENGDMFEGKRNEFEVKFFHNATNGGIKDWCFDRDYKLKIDGKNVL